MTPLPTPFSPVIRTLASDGPTRVIIWRTGCIAGATAIRLAPPWLRNNWFSASSRSPLRSALLSSACVQSIESSRSFSHGFWTKSRAPRRIASTATSTLPHAVITTTGSVESTALIRVSRSSPSWPDVVSRV